MLNRALGAVRRRWYVVVVILAAFSVLGWYFAHNSGTYYAKTAVWFTQDAAPTILPANGAQTADIIAFAGAVASEINRGRPPANYASSDAPYYGAGVRQGVLVALRNVGGQWSSWYNAAVIELHIVGPTEEWVAQQRDGMLDRIEASVGELSGFGESTQKVTVAVEPLTRDITYIYPSRPLTIIALSAMGLGGVLAAGWAALVIDAVVGRRHVIREAQQTADVGPREVVRT